MDQSTTSMALRYYNVGEWAKYYLAFPNYGKKGKSANRHCLDFAVEIQRYAQSLCRQPEVVLPRAPEKATVRSLIKLIRRANSLIGSRLILDNDDRKQLDYNDPAFESFFILPVPLWSIQSQKLRGWAVQALRICQTIMHHGDNQFQSGYTEKFRDDVWPAFRDIQREIAVELLGLSDETVRAPGFLLDEDTHLANYNPEAYDVSTEQWWTPSGIPRLSMDGWQMMTQGIPTDSVPPCPEFPMSSLILGAGGTGDGTGIPLSPSAAGATGSAASSGATFNLDSK